MDTTKNLKPGDFIAEERYIVKTPEGEECTYTMTLEKSGAFEYGNGTCMTLKCEVNGKRCMNQYYDTRYCNFAPNGEGFKDWSLKWIKNYCREDCTIERA